MSMGFKKNGLIGEIVGDGDASVRSFDKLNDDDSVMSDIRDATVYMNLKSNDTTQFEKPPSVKSPLLYNFKTPPQQTGPTFMRSDYNMKDNVTNTRSYEDIQNLPTPIAPNINHGNRTRPYFFGSPEMENGSRFGENDSTANDDDNNYKSNQTDESGSTKEQASLSSFRSTSSILRIPKTRQSSQARRNILVETNNLFAKENISSPVGDKDKATTQRFLSEFKVKDRRPSNEIIVQPPQVNTFEDLTQPQMNQSFQKPSFLPNIKPVDRVVSLPVHKLKELNSDYNEKVSNNSHERQYKTQDVSNLREKEGASIHSLHYTTYSIDGKRQPQHWNISYEVGSGAFSKVYLANDSKTAIKVTDVNFNRMSENSEELRLRIQNSLTRELSILKTLQHPNIIKLVGTDYFDDEAQNSDNNGNLNIDRIVMAMDYCRGGDLFSFVLDHRASMSIDLIACIFSNIVSAVCYMHNQNICHRDIKLENILLKYNQLDLIHNGVDYTKNKLPIVVLSDFGLSKKIDPNDPMLLTRCGSEDYVSPELLLGMPYDGKQNDCWSLGVVLYTILESRLPFDQLPNEKVKTNTRNSKPSHRIAMISWTWYTIKDENSESFKLAKQVVKSLLTKRNKRATIDQVADNEWCAPYVVKM